MITRTAQQKADRPAFFKNQEHPEFIEPFTGTAAWTDTRYKLYVAGKGKKSADTTELYDLKNDREETTNIASQYPEMVQRMVKDLDAWRSSVETSLTGADYETR
jgi:hypothetical protein